MKRDQSPRDLGPRAVDVGHYNVKFTQGRKRVGDLTPIACALFPAVTPRVNSAEFGSNPGESAYSGCIAEVDGVPYFVGEHAEYASTGVEPRTVSAEYSVSARYLALLRGALYYMAVDAGNATECVIPDLVVGLPLSTYKDHRESLKLRAEGVHQVKSPKGTLYTVRVERAHVLIQPFGALLNFGNAHSNKMNGWTLVVDPGGGTLDWFVSTKERSNFVRSGAFQKGMLACAYAVADHFGKPGWKDDLQVIQSIDSAIREGASNFVVGRTEYPAAEYAQVVDAVVEESIGKMLAKVGSTDAIERILVTGGGAPLFHRYLVKSRPELAEKMELDEDSVYSNVRGFHIYGELKQRSPVGA